VDLAAQRRPPATGSGRLLEIRKIEQSSGSQAVNLTNWGEGASSFANSIEKMLGPMFEAMSKPSQVGNREPTDDADQSSYPPGTGEGHSSNTVTPFRGEMVFHREKVTLCGADICSGPRSDTRRQLLEILCQRKDDGTYVASSGDEISKKMMLAGGAAAAVGLIRDLRDEIIRALQSEAGISCDRHDVVLSGGPGYRLAPFISIRHEIPSVQVDAAAPSQAVGYERSSIDDPDDPDVPDGAGPGDPAAPEDAAEWSNDSTSTRRIWILDQLGTGRVLRAPAIVKHFGCSMKTAKRDLRLLREQGKIEYVGNSRTGSYRVKRSPDSPG
jgi:hypothetical protein